ncbi:MULTISPECIES: AAA family ATPase [unclassified Curtobacterium]|uniref:AAA family ATPase n=1 Tax=unclassified Curtobacterium TaxID=257496 RepID=UPI000DAAB641|nr:MULTISPECIES: AAA family ATPase [unclassified Curtobacterium]PZE25337.1 AAA family ATPase [Curtobacterium sp. MCBD17_028]PZE75361.1 AAA family ATPase [Curtobacterium sp. MCBD17_019]PZF61395.1 AAA family ATPase [Curtobacterium sp. MCBD17_013]WIB62862.1 AAA family ATPase [Curtobacterium sp. MCBD17_040]WIB66701.1 AAA family ATPase [Curtobacterium sp. MCBD17_035]
MPASRLPVRRIEERGGDPMPRGVWPATLAPVAQVLESGLDLDRCTVLVGDNGAGKSTIVEGLAIAFGLNAEGGSTGAVHRTRASESTLGDHLRLVRDPGAERNGTFLRAETMYGFFTYLEQHPGGRPEPVFHERSHGEAFLDFVADRSTWPGLWLLDEPESALSFQGCLELMRLMQDVLTDPRAQIVLSTHSPILASFPGAKVHEVGEWGIRPSAWEDLELVRNWRAYLDAPERYLRHLL